MNLPNPTLIPISPSILERGLKLSLLALVAFFTIVDAPDRAPSLGYLAPYTPDVILVDDEAEADVALTFKYAALLGALP
ncbi:hypothetical protein C0991_002380 [Blastosporella zonata]|nr:hypothetical protein C0991_002380 [Blastosporella zonata]